ncbi:MAG: hypothetical protein V1792_23450 [Pseudomonadota bacterium]
MPEEEWYFGVIESLQRVWAQADTPEERIEEFREALEVRIASICLLDTNGLFGHKGYSRPRVRRTGFEAHIEPHGGKPARA